MTGEGVIGREHGAYSDKLGADELGDFQEIVVAGHAQEKGDRVADIARDELDRERRIVDVEVAAPPGEKAVCQSQKREDAEQRGEDHTRDLQP